jgi:hypothetical protein
MGNTTSPEFDSSTILFNARKPSYLLKFDRILDAENEVYIGIGDSATQMIRIGDYHHKSHKLLNFKKSDTKLKYEFEDNVTLIFEKRNDQVHMNLVDLYSNKTVSKPVDPFIKRHFKPIHLKPCSNDLDAISDMFNS